MGPTTRNILATVPPGGEFWVSLLFVSRSLGASFSDMMILVYDSDVSGSLTPLSSSTNSIDDILNGEDADIPVDAWKSELHTRVVQIVDRKRSSTEGRADSLN